VKAMNYFKESMDYVMCPTKLKDLKKCLVVLYYETHEPS
jgi:hypothetical protein